MSRITKDQNQWGAGDLNGVPSSVKTNEGDHVKRYGPLGLGGLGGVTNNNGKTHDVVFELSGNEIQTEDGVINTEAFKVEVPAFSEIVSCRAIVSHAFDATSVAEVQLDGVDVMSAPQDVAVVGTFDVPLGAGVKTGASGGSLTVDLSALLASGNPFGGFAEIVVSYEKV